MSMFHRQLTTNFLCISKVWSMFHHGSVGRVQSKECYLMFTDTFRAFIVVFDQKNCLSIIFISCFDEVSNFPNRILTSQKAQLVIKNCQWNCMLWNKENNFAFISHRTATAGKGSYAAIYKR